MTLISFTVGEAASLDADENGTEGVIAVLQLGPLVLEWWVTRRKGNKRS